MFFPIASYSSTQALHVPGRVAQPSCLPSNASPSMRLTSTTEPKRPDFRTMPSDFDCRPVKYGWDRQPRDEISFVVFSRTPVSPAGRPGQGRRFRTVGVTALSPGREPTVRQLHHNWTPVMRIVCEIEAVDQLRGWFGAFFFRETVNA
jgi:hypothetical protein